MVNLYASGAIMAATGNIGSIAVAIYNYLSGKQCQVFASPFDLRLPDTNEKDEDQIKVSIFPDLIN